MGQVIFSSTFFGGNGNLDISFQDIPDRLHLTPNHRTETVTLPEGVDTYTISGDSPNGAGGNIHLNVSGDVMSEIDKDFRPGLIDPQDFTVIVTN